MVVAALDFGPQLIAFDDGDFEVDPAELEYVVDLDLVPLALSFEPLENGVQRLFVADHHPHRFVQVHVGFPVNLFFQLGLGKHLEVVLLGELLLLVQMLGICILVRVQFWHA